MNRSVFSIILLALIGRLCVAEIVVQPSEPEHLTHLYDATVDILMTCYGHLGSAVGIIGDSDDSILKRLRLKYFIPVVLIDPMSEYHVKDTSKLHELQAFVVAADSPMTASLLLRKLRFTVWWNQYASFLFVDTKLEFNRQCLEIHYYVYLPTTYGVHNTQFICNKKFRGISIFNSNQFTRQAPPVWRYLFKVEMPKTKRLLNIFYRIYRRGGQVCKALNFPKTIDIDGAPVGFITQNPRYDFDINNVIIQVFIKGLSIDRRKFFEAGLREQVWLIDNIVRGLNATRVILYHGEPTYEDDFAKVGMAIIVDFGTVSSYLRVIKSGTREMILPLIDTPMFAVTQHTGHMSQLNKILSVIDGTSRIGMYLVYLITFLFFKFFVGQAVMPALLNLVRLTCSTGLPKLPQNLAAKIYLACLLMFVVTLQGIYTGNLASLLTTTIAYRNVERKEDIPYLGYTVYIPVDSNAKLAADPVFDGRVIEIPQSEDCIEYVLRDPLAACVDRRRECVHDAMKFDLHISRDPMVLEYIFHLATTGNPLKRRIEVILRRLVEHGLWYQDPITENLRVQYITDDEVKKNTFRRVMTLHDLRFAFIILGVGLLCSSVCLIGEIVICEIRLKIAKRRNRVRARLAWGVKKNAFLSFPSLNCRFNARRFFSKRR